MSYKLASMNNEFQKKYEAMDDARSIILHLKEFFDENGRTSRYEISKALYRMRMAEGSSVNDHVLKMIWHIEELARLNLVMDNDLAVDLILQSLPDSFSGFVQNFHMHKMEKTLAELHSMLVVYEKEMHNTRPHMIAMAKASSSKSKTILKKKKWKKPVKTAVQPKPKVEKGKCHYCGVMGHWRRNCKKYLASLKVKTKNQPCEGMVSMLIETNMMVSAESSLWILDSAATSHICMSLQNLEISRILGRNEIVLTFANGARVAALTIGMFQLCLP